MYEKYEFNHRMNEIRGGIKFLDFRKRYPNMDMDYRGERFRLISEGLILCLKHPISAFEYMMTR